MSAGYIKLLEPMNIANLEIPNRIVKAPQFTGLSNMDGSVSERLVRHYRKLAEGGMGLIMVECAYVDKIASKSSPCQLGICDTEYIPGLAWLVDTIKEEGCRAGIQIEHCGRQRLLGTKPVKSASDVVWPALYQRIGSDAVPEPLTIPEIETIVEAFAEAASRAKNAGFDLVEINGAHGCLITNFLSPHTNKRTDVYGGSPENRRRFLMQVFESVRDRVGDDFPVTVRLSGTDYQPDGFGIEETIEVCKELESQGANAVHISGGDHQQMIHEVSPMFIPAGHNVWAAEAVKKAVRIPVIASGSITTPELAREIIESGKGDFIGLGRPLWADRFWVKKLREGRPEDIRPCIRCNEGCLERSYFNFKSVTCAVNPELGREGELEIVPVAEVKKVSVVGGGPAGMEAARVCAMRGYQVTLYEKRELGGALIEASTPRFKADIIPYMEYLRTQMKKLNITIVYEEATFDKIMESDCNIVIVAAGAEPAKPDVPGVNKPFVYDVMRVLNNDLPLGREIVIVGGGLAGAETALWLDEKDKDVTIVEALDKIMNDCAFTEQIALTEKLAISGVKVIVGKKLKEITDDGVVVENGITNLELKADSVIIAAGYKPLKRLAEELKAEGSREVYEIGDCLRPGKIYDAVHSAYMTAMRI